MASSHYKNIEFITQEIVDGNLPPQYMSNPRFVSDLQALIDSVSDQARDALTKNEWLENDETRLVMRILTSLYDLNEKEHNGMLHTIGFTSEQVHLLNKEFAKIFNNDVDLMLNSIKQKKPLLEMNKIHSFVHARNSTEFKHFHHYNAFVEFVQGTGSASMKAERTGLLALYLQYQFTKDCAEFPALQHFVERMDRQEILTQTDQDLFKALLNERLNRFAEQPGFIRQSATLTTTISSEKGDLPVNHVLEYIAPEQSHNYGHRVSPARRFDAHALIDNHLHVMCMTSNSTLNPQNRQSSSIAVALHNTQTLTGTALFNTYTVETVIIPKEAVIVNNHLQDALVNQLIDAEAYAAFKTVAIHEEILHIMADHGDLQYTAVQPHLTFRHVGQYTKVIQPKSFSTQLTESFQQLQKATDVFATLTSTYGLHRMETEMSSVLNSLNLSVQYLAAVDHQHEHVSADAKEALITQLSALLENYPKLENDKVRPIALTFNPGQRLNTKNNQFIASQAAVSTMLEHTRHMNNMHARMTAVDQLAKQPDAFAQYKAQQAESILSYVYEQGFHQHFCMEDNSLSLSVLDIEHLLRPMIEYVAISNKVPHVTAKGLIPSSDVSLLQTLYHYTHLATPAQLHTFLATPTSNGKGTLGDILQSHPYFVDRIHRMTGLLPVSVQEQYRIVNVDSEMNVHTQTIDVLSHIRARIHQPPVVSTPSL